MSYISNNVRIAKNTVFLYLRTLVVIVVSLYTSRVLLKVLGVDRLGIYNLVGGVVALMAFLQSAQSKATSRFITYELGVSNDSRKIAETFSLSMTIHIIISIIVLLFCETIGLWIVNHWTEIPADKVAAANVVYQFAIVTFCIHVVRIPYDSVIIAHEEMSVYAYMSILEAGLQLGAVLLLSFADNNVLELYGASVCIVAVILFLCYMVYVRLKHPGYRFYWKWDKEKSKEILSFSGWTMVGGAANTGTQQGVNLLLNNFVGLVANTALGFANQVNVAVGKFVNGFSTAFTPQVIKLYARNEFGMMHTLMSRASKFSFALCFIIALPLIFNMEFLLRLWLGEVPSFTTDFCRLILLCTIIDATSGIFNIAITSTGHIRRYQLLLSLSFCLDLGCAAILLMLEVNPVLVFASRIIWRGFLNMGIGFHQSRILIGYNIRLYFHQVLFPVFITATVTTLIVFFLFKDMTDGWIKLIASTVVSTTLVLFFTFYIIMSNYERSKVLTLIKTKMSKHI